MLKNNSLVKKRELFYEYDHLNRLVRRRLDNTGGGTVTQTDVYAHEGYQVALQFSAATSGTLAASTLSRRCLWSVSPDELLADEMVSTPAVTSNVLWAVGDHLGRVRDLLRYNGSATAVTNHLTYNAFGVLTAKTSAVAADNTLFAYTGKWTDAATGLQWNINRWYDATTGKWISEDPIGFRAEDMNLYRYVGNRPIILLDYLGLYDDCTIKVYVGHGPRDALDYAAEIQAEGAGKSGLGMVAAIACNKEVKTNDDINGLLVKSGFKVPEHLPKIPKSVVTFPVGHDQLLWQELLKEQIHGGLRQYKKPGPIPDGALSQTQIDKLWPNENDFRSSNAATQRDAYNAAATTVYKAFVQALYWNGLYLTFDPKCCNGSKIIIEFKNQYTVTKKNFVKKVWGDYYGQDHIMGVHHAQYIHVFSKGNRITIDVVRTGNPANIPTAHLFE